VTEQQKHWVRYFIDYVGLAAFLIAYLTTHDLMKATFAIVVGSVIGLIAGLIVERRVVPLPAFVGGAALVFGTLTLVFKDPRIIMMKPTFINLILGLILLVGLALKRNPLKLVMGTSMVLPDQAWRRLTINFGLFYLALAGLNEAIWRTQPQDVWVLFRFPGLLILTFLFGAAHVPFLMHYAKAEDLPPPPTE
jgi:intracellular septation protein